MGDTAPSSGWEARKSSGEHAEPGLSTRDEARGSAPMSRGPWRRVALSARDWEVLAWAHEQKFLMFDQVAQWFPQGAANPHSPPKETPTPIPSVSEWTVITATIVTAFRASAPWSAPR